MNKIFNSKKGEAYIELCVHIIIFVGMLIVAINVLSFANLYVEMGRVADELVQTASFNGGFTDEFWETDEKLKDKYFSYDVSIETERYFNETYKRVQLGDFMSLTVTKQGYLKGIGGFKIPVTVSVSRSCLSEKYWK
ncbi:MAG: DUF4320 family protein [Acutalibacteraceae bacterium]